MSIYASTPTVNTDPEPWATPRHGGGNVRYPLDNGKSHLNPNAQWSPRPQFDQPRAHEANPILLEIREDMREFPLDIERELARLGRDDLNWDAHRVDGQKMRTHARRVLERLAVFA